MSKAGPQYQLMMWYPIISGEEGVGGGGGGGGKQRHNSSDKNIREYFSKHPSSSPVRHTGAKSPSPNYPMVSEQLSVYVICMLLIYFSKLTILR